MIVYENLLSRFACLDSIFGHYKILRYRASMLHYFDFKLIPIIERMSLLSRFSVLNQKHKAHPVSKFPS